MTKIKPVTREELGKAMVVYMDKHKDAYPIVPTEGDNPNIFVLEINGDQKKAAIVEGQSKPAFNDDTFGGEILQIITDNRDAEKDKPAGIIAERPASRSNGVAAMTRSNMPNMQVQALTVEDIKKYICPKATDEELYLFLRLVQAKGPDANPFEKCSYLIKYDANKPAAIVMGKEYFTRKAERHPQFDGLKAGIIINNMNYREGAFLVEEDTLLGGWAEVYRKDRKVPFRMEVSLKDFQKRHPGPWQDMPAIMIRKVALVSALREAFPLDLAGCYDESEISVDPAKEVRPD